jgi:hypothetical protein
LHHRRRVHVQGRSARGIAKSAPLVPHAGGCSSWQRGTSQQGCSAEHTRLRGLRQPAHASSGAAPWCTHSTSSGSLRPPARPDQCTAHSPQPRWLAACSEITHYTRQHVAGLPHAEQQLWLCMHSCSHLMPCLTTAHCTLLLPAPLTRHSQQASSVLRPGALSLCAGRYSSRQPYHKLPPPSVRLMPRFHKYHQHLG